MVFDVFAVVDPHVCAVNLASCPLEPNRNVAGLCVTTRSLALCMKTCRQLTN